VRPGYIRIYENDNGIFLIIIEKKKTRRKIISNFLIFNFFDFDKKISVDENFDITAKVIIFIDFDCNDKRYLKKN